MSYIRQVDHATEPTKGWELSLYYTAGKGYYMTTNLYTKSDPNSPFHAIELFGKENTRKDLLVCSRASSKREAEAITIFNTEVAEFITAHPVKQVEKFVVNVGDRFFQKAGNWHSDFDKIITILSVDEHWYYGITDHQIEEKQWRTSGYKYADLVDLERLEPASEFELHVIKNKIEGIAKLMASAKQERQAIIEKGRSLVPSWAKAAIVARLLKDESDSQSDYFNGSVVDKRVLGFSKSDRNDFAEMRKFAVKFPDTAHLIDKDHENRENYSGGGGLYLGTHRYHGWQVEKNSYGLHSDDLLYALGKHGLPDTQPAEVSPDPEVTHEDGVVIRRNEEQNGIEVVFPEKPDRSVCEKLKSLGFRFSRAKSLWYTKYSEMRERQVKSALGVA